MQYQSDSWDFIGRAPGCWLHKPALSSTMPGKTSVKLPHRAAPKMCALVKFCHSFRGPSKDTLETSLLQLPSPPLPLLQALWCLASQIRHNHPSQDGLTPTLPYTPLLNSLRPRTLRDIRGSSLLTPSIPGPVLFLCLLLWYPSS